MGKRYLSKKMKLAIAVGSSTLAIVPMVAVSAVACSSESSGSAITIRTQPQSKIATVGQTTNMPTFSVTVNEIKDATLTYQWYSNTTNSNSGGTKIANATTSSYTVTADNVKNSGTTYFYVEISGKNGGNALKMITSSAVSLTVNAVPTIAIKTQPQPQTAFTNDNENLPSFSVTATPIDNATLTYQWYSNTTNSNSGGTEIDGATNDSYTVTSSDVSSATTKYYYVKISGTFNGVSLTSISSNPASLTVQAKPTIAISTQPTAQNVVVGTTQNLPSFSVTATPIENATLTYQWYSNTTNSNSGGTAIDGATNSTYQILVSDVASATTKYYYVTVSGTINSLPLTPVSSNPVALNAGYSSVANATTALSSWLTTQENQKSVLTSYFVKNNPLSIIDGNATESNATIPLWGYNFTTLPSAKLDSLNFVSSSQENQMPFGTWQVQATTTAQGTYEIWNSSTNKFDTPTVTPIGTVFTFNLPFDFAKNASISDGTNTAIITNSTSASNGSSTINFSITQATRIPHGKIGGSFITPGETKVTFYFSEPIFYSFTNTNSDLPAYTVFAGK